jgi:enterochelin esterase family protein
MIPQSTPFRRVILSFVIVFVTAATLTGCSLPNRSTPTSTPTVTDDPTVSPTVTPQPTDTITPTLTLTLTPTLTPTATATPLPPVTVDSLPITSNYLGNSRVLSVYLPPDYTSQPQQRFKVLYSNDGQDLPTLGLEEYLNGFYASDQMEQIIVVGIPANDNRIYEYGTGPIKDADGLGASAQAYLYFLFKEVIPLINSKYRTLTGPENTGYMGWSLGALTAFYASWTHPEVFGIVGSISGSYWWRTNINSLPELLASRVIQKMVRESTTRPALRMWFSVGTAEDTNDRDKNGVIDMVQDTTDLLAELTQKGYQNGVDYVYEQVAGGTHDLASFSLVLPDFLRWAFPPA